MIIAIGSDHGGVELKEKRRDLTEILEYPGTASANLGSISQSEMV